jgi:class 3 adenylate cyclase
VSSVNESLLDERLAALEKVRTWSPRLVSRLESHIRSADDRALFRINPFSFAKERGLSESEVIDLLLHATALGLFTMDWALFCPQCCFVAESLRSLKYVHDHYHCAFCQIGYDTALDAYIAIGFTVSPGIRAIAHHRPGDMSAWDNFFETRHTRDGVLPDGTPLVEAKAQLARVASYLPPGETTRLEIDVDAGTVLGASPEGRAAFLLPVRGAPAAAAQTVPVAYGGEARAYATGEAAPGHMIFEVDNPTADRDILVVAVLPPGFDPAATGVRYLPFLDGKRLLTTQTFRDLFRSEVIQASEGLAVRDVALLFTDLKGSTALYDRIGDLNAFALVQRHFDRLQDVTVRHGGAIVKTIGDAVMAAFLTPADAVAAALEMRREIAGFNDGASDRTLILKIGVHAGAVIAVTLNERLDYFGQTVNIAARVQQLAGADEIYISEDVQSAPGVAGLLGGFDLATRQAKLPGVQHALRVFRIPAVAGG